MATCRASFRPTRRATRWTGDSNPALANELTAINTQVGKAVNDQFAGAGRLGSPDNARGAARGIALGDAGVFQNAATNQLSAANHLYGAGNTTAQGLGSLDTANAGIQSQGVNNANTAFGALAAPQLALQTALAQQANPIQMGGLLSSIYGGLGTQFGQTNTNNSSTGSSTLSPIQQFLMAAQGFNQIMSPFTKTPAGAPGAPGSN